MTPRLRTGIEALVVETYFRDLLSGAISTWNTGIERLHWLFAIPGDSLRECR